MRIESVGYSADSGPILPEMHWHEEILITREKAVLTRNGKTPGTLANVGSWEGRVNPQEAAAFFGEIEAVDCSAIRRVEPDEIPEGGGVSSYTLTYTDGSTCVLQFDPGATYPGSAAITGPVDSFIRTVDFPRESLLQIRSW